MCPRAYEHIVLVHYREISEVDSNEAASMLPIVKRQKGCQQYPEQTKDEQAISESSLNKLVGAVDVYNLEEMEPPHTLMCDLRPYQKQALYWMSESEKGVDVEKAAKTLHPCWAEYRICDERATVFPPIFLQLPSIMADQPHLFKLRAAEQLWKVAMMSATPNSLGKRGNMQKRQTLAQTSQIENMSERKSVDQLLSNNRIEYDRVNGFLSAARSNFTVSDSQKSYCDGEEAQDHVFSPPLLMDSSFLGDPYEDLLDHEMIMCQLLRVLEDRNHCPTRSSVWQRELSWPKPCLRSKQINRSSTTIASAAMASSSTSQRHRLTLTSVEIVAAAQCSSSDVDFDITHHLLRRNTASVRPPL
ncbi:DNA repair protein RAD5B [Camellia lanceoleosa]|uniref:DNA repair protein RAD5B n=1 Tax=Camellia lanceoleosa TaxID=1840588 RepID=A0ACC0H937_9ERIC|nr:DNA repair protein RAD5B [Camellia lanceoleosa]